MTFIGISISAARNFLVGSTLLAALTSAFGQVSPTEVLNPRAKADEQKYLPQLLTLQRAIGSTDFPFTFRLARYLDAKPGQRAALDSNGIEFVYFQQRVVLKVSGFYRVAFDSMQVTTNGRASQALQEAILPVLRLVTQQVPQSSDYDGIGFEILYDARDSNKSYDYEGREVLTVVFSREDAFALANAATDAARQEILNRSDVYVNGKEFGLALGQSDSFVVQALERPAPRQDEQWSSSIPAIPSRAAAISAPTFTPAVSRTQPEDDMPSAPSSTDAAPLRAKSQAQSTAVAKTDGAQLHMEDDKAPSLETNGDQKLLHFTMQNTLLFERTGTSIYKRAAQSFDLFLAPELKDISKKLPADAALDALHFSVLNHLGTEKNETIEYICPMNSMRSFIENKITSQDLINKSTVLVNGVRIGLDLQLVE
jgi:hypothetical protein